MTPDEAEAFLPQTGSVSAGDIASAARATGGGIRSREVAAEFEPAESFEFSAAAEWAEVEPGLQCRLSKYVFYGLAIPEKLPGGAVLEFRRIP